MFYMEKIWTRIPHRPREGVGLDEHDIDFCYSKNRTQLLAKIQKYKLARKKKVGGKINNQEWFTKHPFFI